MVVQEVTESHICDNHISGTSIGWLLGDLVYNTIIRHRFPNDLNQPHTRRSKSIHWCFRQSTWQSVHSRWRGVLTTLHTSRSHWRCSLHTVKLGGTMRKIEAQMNAAIAGRRNWAKDNTRVEVNKHGDTFVYLHGHNIATISNEGDIRLSSCGWETVTTKSRLNAILDCFVHNIRIFQRDWQWYISGRDFTEQFFDGYVIQR